MITIEKGENGCGNRYPTMEVGTRMLITGMSRSSGQRLVADRNKAVGRLYRARTVADGVIVTRHR
jgi:hypothetical protein